MTYSVKQISDFFTISPKEITSKCRTLGIKPTGKSNINSLLYKLSQSDVAKILLFLDLKLPEKIIIKETYEIYESKINTDTIN